MELFPHALQKAESGYLNFHNPVLYRLLKWEKAERRAEEYSEASTASRYRFARSYFLWRYLSRSIISTERWVGSIGFFVIRATPRYLSVTSNDPVVNAGNKMHPDGAVGSSALKVRIARITIPSDQ